MQGIIRGMKTEISSNKVYYFIVLLVFCIGIVLGAYTIRNLIMVDRQDLSNYYTQFVEGIGERTVDYGSLFFDVLKKNGMLIIPIVLVSFTFLGAPLILIIDLIKGYTLGYTFTFLLSTFSGKGIGIALSTLLPQNIFYIPCFIALSIIGITISKEKLMGKITGKKALQNTVSIQSLSNNLIVILCIFIVGIIIETYVCPNITKWVVTRFYY